MSDSKERLAESVSALMDGEVSEMELHRILKEVGIDQDQSTGRNSRGSVRGIWQRYNMVSASIAGDPVTMTDLSGSIAAAIDAEDTHKISPFANLMGGAGRFAIAASVAMVAVLGVQQLNSPDPASADAMQFTQMDISGAQQNNGPALQSPAGCQPNAPGRTVASGGNVNTSRPAAPVVTFKPSVQRKFSERELRGYMDDIMMKHSNNAALNSNHGMLPFARVNAAGARTDKE